MSKFKIFIICLISIIIMIGGVLFFNHIIDKDKNKKEEEKTVIDVSDANNVSIIDGKLGSETKITQGYLLNYTVRKSGIWYESSGYVKAKKIKNSLCYIEVSEDKNSTLKLTLTIDKDKCNVNKGDIVNFVGTIDINEGILELSKISKEEIGYSNVENIKLDDLIKNIELIRENVFVINGYMITDEDEYKLFDSKEAYEKNSSAGNYFLINWKEIFMYTGNQTVTIKCNLLSTYELKNCELIK